MALTIRLTKGTIEIIPATVVDGTGVVSDLSGASPKYDVMDDLDVFYYNAVATTAVGNHIQCLLNTTATGPTGVLWAVGHYRLFVRFTVGAEIVRLGPADIYLTET